jgi:hypothetical protein
MTAIRPALDLTRYHWRATHGDLTTYGTWYLAEDSGPKPCLVLLPTHKQSWEKATPCVVMLEDMWRWSDLGDEVAQARVAVGFAENLGLDIANPRNALRVRGIICDHIGDMLSMPPMPAAMRNPVVIGEAKVTSREGGNVVRHHEVIEHH